MRRVRPGLDAASPTNTTSAVRSALEACGQGVRAIRTATEEAIADRMLAQRRVEQLAAVIQEAIGRRGDIDRTDNPVTRSELR
jgi:hypothetical protein